jgi:hypothetical protein
MWAEATLKSLCQQIELFERAAAFEGRPRERMVALGEAEELYFRLRPHHYRAIQAVRVVSQMGKVGSRREDYCQHCESRLISLLMHILLDGVQSGDLRLRDGQRPEELAFTIWVIAFGARALMDSRVATLQLGVGDGVQIAGDMTTVLLDALGWQPLSTETDYRVLRQRIRSELFAKEWREVRDMP